MSVIALEGMKFHAFHGVHPEEQSTGCDFIVDIHVVADTSKAAASDDVSETINYELVYAICKQEMEIPRKLIETVCSKIMDQLKRRFPKMEALTVKIKKLNPPLGGRVDASSVLVEQTFVRSCPRCKTKKFHCFGNKDCWCNDLRVYSATREELADAFGAECLCQNCLKEFAG